MISRYWMKLNNHVYQIAVLISSLSMAFGILREFLIIGFIGFSSLNDNLQLYLSIFYTIGLSIDAMRLSCLNLYSVFSLRRMLLISSIVSLPFSFIIGFTMSYSIGHLDKTLLIAAIIGGYLNLTAALLITYKQRNNSFLLAQLINVMPNFILIPGIIFYYYLFPNYLLPGIVYLTSSIAVFQCIFLLLLPSHPKEKEEHSPITLLNSLLIFLRHFSAMVGEQLFQIITRRAFYEYGTGYLSLFAIAVRIYSAGRFILVDSFIGARLANWKKEFRFTDDYLLRFINSTLLGILIVAAGLLVSLQNNMDLLYASIQMIIILILGFYFSTLVRIIYFKINRYENNSSIVMRFAVYELIAAMVAFVLTKQLNYPLLALVWIGYIAKPFLQLLLLKKRYQKLELN